MTRGEVEDTIERAIAPLATKKELADAITSLATKQELETAISDAKIELHGAIATVMKHMDARFTQQSQELARHVQAILEEMRTMIRAVDDKYADLPERVSRLEAERDR